MTVCRGVRGATTASANDREAILEATRELLAQIIERNQIAADDVAAAFFTVTDDLNAEFPAVAARQLGWIQAALLCAREIPVPTTKVRRCIRVLALVNTDRSAAEITHVYLRDAVTLRPDIAGGSPMES
jgi:monofunctional chorismate mutase